MDNTNFLRPGTYEETKNVNHEDLEKRIQVFSKHLGIDFKTSDKNTRLKEIENLCLQKLGVKNIAQVETVQANQDKVFSVVLLDAIVKLKTLENKQKQTQVTSSSSSDKENTNETPSIKERIKFNENTLKSLPHKDNPKMYYDQTVNYEFSKQLHTKLRDVPYKEITMIMSDETSKVAVYENGKMTGWK